MCQRFSQRGGIDVFKYSIRKSILCLNLIFSDHLKLLNFRAFDLRDIKRKQIRAEGVCKI